ncbi:MAG: polymer-forming cytoskeletal protein [Candidatus Pacebacteria bacterium]|jgi:cytoskeletal protein CcmA (bactofilin family)|nr:polymer-forming cytoskeletal protein [Candidatus Paceibacterota bacterium]MBT3511684.1 polymer-forming cytoskeletal protein [Candidatus Paceibacterota bacterium]MBT4005349.1 polymer-forming cytoskeletal protein [Candidatus Paceibacterota bacterium]MBT4358679.1 polymer-forming cytoskeletal protein [Candidatus Paceibacterota bacterium]MBT4681180.1 polymer-forming cytoskeletal protein [Candidatus Paceibacterota bacterium]
MKNFILFFTILFTALLVPQSVSAAALAERVHGPHFRSGEMVVMTEDLVGDVYVSGGTVMIDGKIDGDLLVGGGTVTLNGEVTEDVRIGAGEVVFNGQVGQDVTVGAGTVTFGPSSEVAGSVIAGSGMVVFNGKVMGDVWAGAGAAQLAGNFGQNVNLETSEMQVLPNAVISGDLNAKYEDKIDVSDQAQIVGEQNLEQRYRVAQTEKARDQMANFGKGMGQAKSGMALILGLVSGLILMYFFPKVTDAVTDQLLKNPLSSLGWGFAKLMIVPLSAVLLMVTVVGLPLAFLMLMGYSVGMMTASWIAGKAIGEVVYKESKVTFLKNRYLQFILGLVLLSLAGLLPLVGWLIKLVAFLMGFGALGMWFRAQVKPEKSKKK